MVPLKSPLVTLGGIVVYCRASVANKRWPKRQ